MSDEIKAGDLVYIKSAPPCCGKGGSVGTIYVVQSVIVTPTQCKLCGHIFNELSAKRTAFSYPLLRRIKKIPPLSELESAETKEEVPA